MTMLIRQKNINNPFEYMERMLSENPRFVGNENPNSLALDIQENDDGFTIIADVPGINPDNIDIRIHDNVLTIKGEFDQEEVQEGQRLLVRERRSGSFSRSVKFPIPVNGEESTAHYDNGVLNLNLPKIAEAKPHVIQVKTK
ncbi:hypothetical protein MASR2M15_20800 [Anaerolineales bacterium]